MREWVEETPSDGSERLSVAAVAMQREGSSNIRCQRVF